MSLSLLDRLLPFWIIGAMILGVILGYFTDIGTVFQFGCSVSGHCQSAHCHRSVAHDVASAVQSAE